MKATIENLNDPEWWDLNAPDNATHYFMGNGPFAPPRFFDLTGPIKFNETYPEARLLHKRPDHIADSKDMVNHPPHYQLREGYEVYDLRQDLAKKAQSASVPHDQYSDWDRIIEYTARCWEKNGLEDLKKARWYLNKLIEKMEGKQ